MNLKVQSVTMQNGVLHTAQAGGTLQGQAPCSIAVEADNPLHEIQSPNRDGFKRQQRPGCCKSETYQGKMSCILDRHRDDGETGNEQRHGNESGEIAGKCSHSQLP